MPYMGLKSKMPPWELLPDSLSANGAQEPFPIGPFTTFIKAIGGVSLQCGGYVVCS